MLLDNKEDVGFDGDEVILFDKQGRPKVETVQTEKFIKSRAEAGNQRKTANNLKTDSMSHMHFRTFRQTQTNDHSIGDDPLLIEQNQIEYVHQQEGAVRKKVAQILSKDQVNMAR